MRKKGRRPNNSGNFNWRDGKCYVYMTIPKQEKERNKSGRKLIAVVSSIKEAEKAVRFYTENNAYNIKAEIPMELFLHKWLRISQANNQETTFYTTKSQIENNIIPWIANIKLSEIKSSDIDNLIIKLKEKSLSSNTIKRTIGILKNAFNYAIKKELIIFNPVIKAITIKSTPTKKRIPTKEQSKLLLKEITKEKIYKFPLLFCMLLGLRRGESLGVKWEDIDFNSRTIRINKQITIVGNRIIEKRPKSDSSIRRIMLPDYLISELNKTPKAERFGYLVKQDHRKPNLYYNRFRKITNTLNLTGITIHSLRHYNCSYLLNGGASLDSVSRHLGHSSVRITGDIYAHEIQGTLEKEAMIINKLVEDSLQVSE